MRIPQTAHLTAYYRALEDERLDALFRDPWAKTLVWFPPETWANTPAGLVPTRMGIFEDLTAQVIALRTRIIDELIFVALDDGVNEVINIGAGLDTRPYRLPLPKTLLWVEIDHRRVIEYKEEKLAGETPRCQLRRIGMDIVVSEGLAAAGLPERDRVLIVTEGLLMYLGKETVAAFADELAGNESIDYWIVEYIPQKIAPMVFNWLPYRTQIDDWPHFFEEHSWYPKEIRYLPEEGERLGRPLPATDKHCAGYALLCKTNPLTTPAPED